MSSNTAIVVFFQAFTASGGIISDMLVLDTPSSTVLLNTWILTIEAILFVLEAVV